MTQEKLLVIGMGSNNDRKKFNIKLDGKEIPDYFHDLGVKVYHHPNTNGFLTTSIHRTTGDSIKYAKDMSRLVGDGHRLAGVFYGGLALALPGVVAAEACDTPVEGVPGDGDAFYNVYKIPDGTSLATVQINDLETALKLAGRIFTLEPAKQVRFVAYGDCPTAEDTKELLGRFVDFHEEKFDPSKKYDGLTICLANCIAGLVDFDKAVEESGLGIVGLEKKVDTGRIFSFVSDRQDIVSPNYRISNSLLIGRPKNLALMAARIVAGYDPKVRNELIKFRQEEAAKYEPYVKMELKHFK